MKKDTKEVIGCVIACGLFAFAAALVLRENRELKREAERQLNSILGSTKKIVSGYKGVANLVGQDGKPVSDQDDPWDNLTGPAA